MTSQSWHYEVALWPLIRYRYPGDGPMPQLFARLEPEDKVLLVGDVRQHQAVEAGSPFEQLQQHGMTTAALSEIVRQRDKDLKQTVEELALRNTPEAVAALVSRGKVIELPDER